MLGGKGKGEKFSNVGSLNTFSVGCPVIQLLVGSMVLWYLKRKGEGGKGENDSSP